jgi:hypothetical protein
MLESEVGHTKRGDKRILIITFYGTGPGVSDEDNGKHSSMLSQQSLILHEFARIFIFT